MTTTTVRLAYADADAADSMRRDAEVAGRRLGVGREARLDRGATSYGPRPPTPAGRARRS